MSNALWYLGRGTGVASLLLLTIVVALGIMTRSGRPVLGLPRFAVAAVHRTASLTAVVFLLIHVGTLYFDPYAQLRVVDLLVPFNGAYRSFWLGLGTVGFDLIAALVVTSLLRHRIGLRTWRAIHWLAYLSWPVALSHALGNGTDNGTWWLRAVAALCTLAVLGAIGWRVSERFQEYGDARRPPPQSNGPDNLAADQRVEISFTGQGVR
jgi:sulfoxide reductase heme-binding subunit YedZ